MNLKIIIYLHVCFTDPTAGVLQPLLQCWEIYFAKPGCLIAFAGKVIQATVKEELSSDFQTAEFVEKHGL